MLIIIGWVGIVGGLAYIMAASLSRHRLIRHNPGLYLSGSIALASGIALVCLLWGH